MKSKPFQSILTALLSAGAMGGIPCTAPLTYADSGQETTSPMTVIEDKGTTWWSVQELLKFYPEVEAEKDAECGDNQDCRMEFGWSMIERGPKYSALSNLLEGQFWVTSINPSAETVKVLFFDNDMMLRHMGIEEKLEIEHLYLGWFDEWKGQIYNYDHDGFTNGSVSGSHPLYDSTVEDIDAIVPWEEVELSVVGGNLIENTTGKLDYALYAKYNMFNAQGHFDYSSCLRAPDYQDGMECQMMVSGDQWVSYFPPRESIIEQTTTNEPGDNETGNDGSDAQPSDPEVQPSNPEIPPVEPETPPSEQGTTLAEPTVLPSESEPLPTESELSITEPENLPLDTAPMSIQVIITDAEPKLPKAPETGKSMRNTNHNVEIPGWFVALSILGALFIIWWFLPNRKKNHQKSQKSSKKVLTKKSDCDKMVSV